MSIFEQLIDAISNSVDIFGGAVVRPAEPGDECYQKLDREFETCAIVSGIDPNIYKKKILKENNYWNDTRKYVFSTKQVERAATDFITRIGLIEQVVVTVEKRWASD